MKKDVYCWTVIIDLDGDADFEDFDTAEEASARAKELCEQGIEAVVGWTD